MPTTCGYPNCKFRSRYRGTEDNRHFYRVPKKPAILRQAWLQAIGRTEQTVVSQLRVCSGHFHGGEKREGDVPVADPACDAAIRIDLPPKSANHDRRTARKKQTLVGRMASQTSSPLKLSSNGKPTNLIKIRPALLNISTSSLLGNGAFGNGGHDSEAGNGDSNAGEHSDGDMDRLAKDVDEDDVDGDVDGELDGDANSGRLLIDDRNGYGEAEGDGDAESHSTAVSSSSTSGALAPNGVTSIRHEPMTPSASFTMSPDSLVNANGTQSRATLNSRTSPLVGSVAIQMPVVNSATSNTQTAAQPSNANKPLVALLDGRDCTIEMPLLKDVAMVAFCDAAEMHEVHDRVLNDALAVLTYSMRLDAAHLDLFRSLRLVVQLGHDHSNIDIHAAAQRGIAVSAIAGVSVEEQADSTLSLILNLYRRTFWLANELRERRSVQGEQLRHLAAGSTRIRGDTLGIIGLGRVGMALMIRAQALGFNIVFYDPFLQDGFEKAIGVARANTLQELLYHSDCIALHCPLNTDTRHLISEHTIRQMRPGAFLVNTSSGGLVDERALARALRDGHIRAAALDVFESEPFNIDESELRDCPNLICTPRCSVFSDQSISELRESAASEIRRAVTGKMPDSLKFCVNRDLLLAAQNKSSNSTGALNLSINKSPPVKHEQQRNVTLTGSTAVNRVAPRKRTVKHAALPVVHNAHIQKAARLGAAVIGSLNGNGNGSEDLPLVASNGIDVVQPTDASDVRLDAY